MKKGGNKKINKKNLYAFYVPSNISQIHYSRKNCLKYKFYIFRGEKKKKNIMHAIRFS